MDSRHHDADQQRESTATAPPLAAPGSQRRRGLVIALLALLVLALISGVWLMTRPVPVQTETVRTGPAIESVYASGVVDFVRQARIAPVVNAPIRAVRVTE